MPWIKRNLVVVISAGVALALIGFGGWFLWSAMDKNKSVDEEIGSLKSELERLTGAPHYPSPSNIAIAQRELKRMSEFTGEAKKFFPSTPTPAAALNNQTFAALLHNTVDELTKQATAAGIRVETNYHFSFETEWLPVSFPPASLRPLSERLAEVKQLATILINSKVNRLEAIRRARVIDEVPGPTAATDYLAEAPNMNAESGMTLWPYELVFQSFSPELGAVLENIARLPEAYVVRSIVVEPAEPLPMAQQRPQNPPPGAPPPGRGGARAAVAPAATPGLETLLNERLLRVVLKVEVIKPGEALRPGEGPGPGPRPPRQP